MTSLRAISTTFGLLMVAAAALQADTPGLIAACGAVVAVFVSVRFHWSASLSVMFCLTALTLSDASPGSCALAGLTATCFLVLGRAVPPQPVTVSTAVGVLAATAIGLAVTAVPVQLPWAPLVAPPAALVSFVVVVYALRRRVLMAASEEVSTSAPAGQ